MVQHIDAHLVRQLERPHREPCAESHGGVDRFDGYPFLVVDSRSLLEIGTEDAGRDEAGDVFLDHDDRLAEGLGKVDGDSERGIARRVRADDFDERHEHRRVEEVHPDDLFRTFRHEGHFRDRQGRGVRRQDRLLRCGRVEFLKDALLQIEVLEDRLDRDVRVAAGLGQVQGRVNPVEGLLHLVRPDLVLLHELAEGPADPFHSTVQELLFDVPHPDLVAVQGRQLGNPVAHLPRTDHREPHRRRSSRRKGGPELKMWWAAPKVHRPELLRSDVDPVQTLIVFAAMAIAVIMPFVVVPEILERKGFNPKSGSVRSLVWVSFLLIVFVPAVASGFLFSVRNLADWAYLGVGLLVAILYDYYRLNPEKVPWSRRRI